MIQPISTAPPNVGFITALLEEGAFTGGYLVTNEWARPLEFRVSTRVIPTRVQKILYGETLEPYVLADLIGSNLLRKTATSVSWILTDQCAFAELRSEIDTPLAYISDGQLPECDRSAGLLKVAKSGDHLVYCHERFAGDMDVIESRLASFRFDLREPFERIVSAIRESERIGDFKDADAKA